jgi:hypothetical protein
MMKNAGLNYSGKEQFLMYSFNKGNDLLTGKTFKKGDSILLKLWYLVILEEETT